MDSSAADKLESGGDLGGYQALRERPRAPAGWVWALVPVDHVKLVGSNVAEPRAPPPPRWPLLTFVTVCYPAIILAVVWFMYN
ncbi:hypothetical protein ACP70R_041383 [Stipagrostis hirtigluma subsp. patula]